jgi:hypothetical protein
MLRIKEHMAFILATLVLTTFSIPAQAGVSIRIGTLSYGQAYGYGYSSGINYYGPSSFYNGRSYKYNRYNKYRGGYYKKHSPSTHGYGYYPFDSYKYRYQVRPSYFYNNRNSYKRGYAHGYSDGYSDSRNARHRYKGARVGVKKRK